MDALKEANENVCNKIWDTVWLGNDIQIGVAHVPEFIHIWCVCVYVCVRLGNLASTTVSCVDLTCCFPAALLR